MTDLQSATEHIGHPLDRWIRSREPLFEGATGAFSQILRDIAYASKVVLQRVRNVALSGVGENSYGELQQKLDLSFNNCFIDVVKAGGEIAALISEEEKSLVPLNKKGKYLLAIDPLDGSSNIGVGAPVGTIFSLYKRLSDTGTPVGQKEFLQPGRKQALAGYVLYGSPAMLVYTAQNEDVHGFTLETGLDEFIFTHPNMRMKPAQEAKIYSINDGLYTKCQPEVQQLMDYFRNEALTGRYIGSLVADFHRNLLKGGIYVYPSTRTHPKGKLRLMHECNALALIAEQAGGMATDGQGNPILDLVPESSEQCVPLYIGNTSLVTKAESFTQKSSAQKEVW